MPDWDTLLSTFQSSRRFDAGSYCFDAQRPFVTSRAKFRTACCSRRSGKTEGSAALLISRAQEVSGCVCLYITKTRINAKRIIWRTLKRIAIEQGLGANAKEAELCLELPNGSSIYLLGANHKDEIEKFRGLPIALVVLDEAQILTNLEELIDDVLVPALMDFDGWVVLAGTPAPVQVGYFWECVGGKEAHGWEHHSWTVFENPWIQRKSGKSAHEHLSLELERKGVEVSNPSIQREWFAKWVYDPNALVFQYSSELNDFESVPDINEGEWECVLGGDLGWDDADALALLRYNTTLPKLWLAEEYVLPKQTITQLGDRLRQLVDAHQPMHVVLDCGGLGKKIAQELTQRWGLNIEAAQKERKFEHIELLNDAMRNGIFHAKKDSQFAKDCMLVEWDKEKSKPDRPKISERFHSDICDAVLYGYRSAKQWLWEPAKPAPPQAGSATWNQEAIAKQKAEISAYWEKKAEEAERRKREEEEADDSARWIG